jgi:hypothetical protein
VTNTDMALVPADAPRNAAITIQDPIPVMDTDRFAQMQRIAKIMAYGSLVPQALTHQKVPGNADPQPLDYDIIVSNCFLVVNQAVRWGMDPFAVAQCVSVVHGKLCYEGKLVAAVMDAKLGIKLGYKFGKWDKQRNIIDLSEEGIGEDLAVRVFETRPDGSEGRFVEGYVGGWKTDGAGSPWKYPANHKRQLRYRGNREWSRAYEPGVMLGVYTDDELSDLQEDARARRAEPANSGVANRLGPPRGNGFNQENITREISGKSAAEPMTSSPAGASAEPEIPDNKGGVDAQVSNSTDQTTEKPRAGGDNPATNSESKAEGAPDDRNGPGTGTRASAKAGAASSSQGDAPASTGKSSDGQGTAGGGPTAGSAPITPNRRTDYSRHLATASVPKSLKTLDQSFRNKHAWTTEPQFDEVLKKIYAVHLDRVNSKIDPKDAHQALAELGVEFQGV